MTQKHAMRTDSEMLDLLHYYKDEFHIESKYFDRLIVEFEQSEASAKAG